jgi:hypothetical protein
MRSAERAGQRQRKFLGGLSGWAHPLNSCTGYRFADEHLRALPTALHGIRP